MGCCKNIFRSWVILANALFVLTGIALIFGAASYQAPIDMNGRIGHPEHSLFAIGATSALLGIVGIYSAFKSDKGCSKMVLCLYGLILLVASIFTMMSGVTSFVFAGVLAGIENEDFGNSTASVNGTSLAEIDAQLRYGMNVTWSVCCFGELPEGEDFTGPDEEEEEEPMQRALRSRDDEDGSDEDDSRGHHGRSEEEDLEALKQQCGVLEDRLGEVDESLHCDDFDSFYHLMLRLMIKGLVPFSQVLILVSGVNFVTMLASCCLVCMGPSRERHAAVNHTTVYASYAAPSPASSSAPLMTSEVVVGNPVY